MLLRMYTNILAGLWERTQKYVRYVYGVEKE